ncbi:hypothetical protein AB4084_29405, partial [Lysobacter sp. 2RAB21]
MRMNHDPRDELAGAQAPENANSLEAAAPAAAPTPTPAGPVDPAAAHTRIVLVGTQHPGNIGSAARAMKT